MREFLQKLRNNSLKLRLFLSLFKDKCIINPLLITKLKSIECLKIESWSAPFVNIFLLGSEAFLIVKEKKLVFLENAKIFRSTNYFYTLIPTFLAT